MDNFLIEMDCVVFVFEWWKKKMQMEHAVLDKKRASLIGKRLNDYPVLVLTHTVTGCYLSDYHMARNEFRFNPKRNKISDIFRDNETVDFFYDIYKTRGKKR